MTTSYTNIIHSCDYYMSAQKFIKNIYYIWYLYNCMCISTVMTLVRVHVYCQGLNWH